MTYKEALEHLKLHEYWADFSWMDEVAELAIEAIEKQIPKKPSGSFNDETYGRAWVCECTGVIDEYQKFCPCCSQAIDWS